MSIPFYLSYTALWILVILHSLIVLGLVRIVHQLQQTAAAAGLPAGSSDGRLKSGQEAPKFSAMDLSGAPISSKDFLGRLTALLFVSPSCPSCTATLYDMEYLSYKAQGNVIVICQAGREDCAALANTYKLNVRLVADEDEKISRLFGISSVPTAVLITNNHIQSYGHPMRGEELEEMFQKAPREKIQEVG